MCTRAKRSQTHIKDPVIHIRDQWITETSNLVFYKANQETKKTHTTATKPTLQV